MALSMEMRMFRKTRKTRKGRKGREVKRREGKEDLCCKNLSWYSLPL